MTKMEFTPTQLRINEALKRLFAAAECWGGRLHMQLTGSENPFGVRGFHESGKEINVYPIELPLQSLLRQYADEQPRGLGLLTIEANLRQAIFLYHPTSAAAQAQAEAAEAAALAAQQEGRRTHLRQTLSPAPFGPELASRAAEALVQGRWFNYGHPAYCGMGFDFVAGHYRYGSVWEGTLEPERTFATRSDFEAWLAQQSDLSLALLEFEDPLGWHNQTVTRARLLELVKQAE